MLRNPIGRSFLAVTYLAWLAVPALAQGPEQRGYITAFGGAGLTTEVTSPFFGGSVGADVSRNVQITADFGRIQNVEAKFTREDLAIFARDAAEAGVAAVATVKMPTNYLSGGIRLHVSSDRTVQPYLMAHGGIAHMSTKPKFTVEGLDMTSVAMTEPAIKAAFKEETRPMATLGAGVTAKVSDHVLVDLGYKYSGIFIKKTFLQDLEGSPHSHTRIDTHRLYAGLGLTF